MLGFRIQLRDNTYTRRGILSVVSSVYNPLGLACPFVLSAKILLQDICKRNLSWDDKLPGEVAKVWQCWLTEVPQLESLQVPRCYKPPGFGEVKSCQVHTFCDARNLGYGAVSYVRLTNSKNVVQCSFLMGKGRVAPLKKITVPRLELAAATIAVKLNKLLNDELEYPVETTHYWTDSMTVLRYLSNDSARFHTFVANRVALIRDASNIDQWRHVDTKRNPADCATRGLSVSKLIQSKLWLEGPDFLWLEEEQWPNRTENVHNLSNDDPEVKKFSNTAVLHKAVDDPIERLIEHFSDWTKLRRALGWILFAAEKLRNRVESRKVNHQTAQSNEIRECKVNAKTNNERPVLELRFIERAEKTLVRFSQRNLFPDDCSADVKVKSKKLSKLDPVMRDGLLRVGGRLEKAHMTYMYDAKHPIILPKESKVSRLILEHIHKNIGHLGKNAILAELRTRYWMIGAVDAIKNLLHRCVICRRYQARASEQKMANLPESRLKPEDPPFTRTGVDYFEPFEVRRARSVVKRYGVIFTSFNMRAVHLEMAPSLDTDACINVLRRFIARRGPVKTIYTDNGTSLVGAEKELRVEIERWNKTQISNFAAQQVIDWHFNPPAASHFGGVWERLIRSVRKVLYSVVHEQVIKFDDDGLHTLLCEVESILNGRPLTESPSSPDDLDVITPNHLLRLRPGEYFPPGTFSTTDNYVRRRWKQVQYLADIFWVQLPKEYLPLLQQRQKWLVPQRNIKVGDIVLVIDNSPRNSWCLGRVVEVMHDKNGLTRIAKLNLPYVILPTHLHSDSSRRVKALRVFKTFIVSLAKAFGAENMSRVDEDANAILEFEIAIANVTIQAGYWHDSKQYNLMTIKELSVNLSSGFDWMRLIRGMMNLTGVGIPITGDEQVLVYSLVHLRNVVALIEKTPKRVLINYILTPLIRYTLSALPKEIGELEKTFFHDLYGYNRASWSSRLEMCYDLVGLYLGNAVDRLYVDRYFDEDAKATVLEMIENLKSAFYGILDEVDWMDNATIAAAKDKVKAMKSNIGYSEKHVKDDTHLNEEYKDLLTDRAKYFENVLSNKRLWTIRELKRLGSVDTPILPRRAADAYFSSKRRTNSMTFPAGKLQPPYFSKNYPESMNFGGIGMEFVKYITYTVDDIGQLFDNDGNITMWWDGPVLEKFNAKAQCITDQYPNITVAGIDFKANLRWTRGESIADNGGLKISFAAYRKWVKDHGIVEQLPPGFSFNHKQLFFLNFAQLRRCLSAIAGVCVVEEIPIEVSMNPAIYVGKSRIVNCFSYKFIPEDNNTSKDIVKGLH